MSVPDELAEHYRVALDRGRTVGMHLLHEMPSDLSFFEAIVSLRLVRNYLVAVAGQNSWDAAADLDRLVDAGSPKHVDWSEATGRPPGGPVGGPEGEPAA